MMHQIEPDEEMLIARAAAGDPESFGALYQQYSDAIYRFILARVREPAEAEDLCGQVFLKAWEAMPGYEQRGHRFSSWLYQIAHNLVIDYYRSQPPAHTVSLADNPAFDGGQENTLDCVIAREESATIARAIAKLPPDQRHVIVLRFFRGLSHGEVARLIDKSRAACRVIQHRALATLSQTLSHYWIVATLTFILLGGGAVYAADSSLPGDTLYPVKRSVEALRLAASLSDRSDALLHLDFAEKRLVEARQLASTARDADLRAALEAYRIELETGVTLLRQVHGVDGEREQWFGDVNETLERYERQLNDLYDVTPPSVRQSIEHAQRTTRGLRAAVPPQSEPAPLPAPTATATARIAATATPVVPTPAATATIVVPLPTRFPDAHENLPTAVPAPLPSVRPIDPPIPTARPHSTPAPPRLPVDQPTPPVETPPPSPAGPPTPSDAWIPGIPEPGSIPWPTGVPRPPDGTWPPDIPWPTGVPRPPDGTWPSDIPWPTGVPWPPDGHDRQDRDATPERWPPPDLPNSPHPPDPPDVPTPPRPPDPPDLPDVPNPPRPPDLPSRP
jgi:RNA polymerase sigma-70 factor (ECF subfamily)